MLLIYFSILLHPKHERISINMLYVMVLKRLASDIIGSTLEISLSLPNVAPSVRAGVIVNVQKTRIGCGQQGNQHVYAPCKVVSGRLG